jgi:transcriptional regulatory protein LevR
VLSLTEKLRSIAETTLKEKFDQRFLYYIGMHIDTYLNKKNRTTHILMPDEITRIKQDYQQEYAVAQRFGQEIANVEAIELPDIEIIYLTLLLSSLRQMPSEKKQQVGILVLAHGTGTASSMVAVANELLGLSNVEALDMPLSVPPTDMLDQMVTKLTHLDRGKGVLLLVDMGSLAHLQEQIEKACSIPVKVIPFVTTLVVLDTVRKANYLDMDLNGLYNSVKNDYIETINTSLRSNDSTLPKAILSICMTGSGTAERLKTIIVNIINKTTSEPIVVRTVSALQLDKFIPKLSKQYNIIATVGTKQTSLKTPHITLESLIAGDGESVLKSTITSQAIPTQKPTLNDDNVVMSNICLDILQNSLIYLNPYLMTTNLIKWMNDLGLALGVHFSNSMMVKTIVHTSFAFERAQTHESIQYPNKFPDALQPKLNAVTSTLSPYEHQLKITIPTDELQFITEIINEESDEKVPTR